MGRMFWMLMLLGTLAGCMTAGRRGNEGPMPVFDLGAPALSTANGAERFMALEVRGTPGMETPGMAYRLAYLDVHEPRIYARSRWQAPPVQLVQQSLAMQLGMQQPGQARTRCLLRLELTEFAQIFTAPQVSVGRVAGRVLLLDAQRSVLATQPVHAERAAPTADARGGVAALSAATQVVGERLSAFVRDELAGRSACPPP